jgi:hypothetical protein
MLKDTTKNLGPDPNTPLFSPAYLLSPTTIYANFYLAPFLAIDSLCQK